VKYRQKAFGKAVAAYKHGLKGRLKKGQLCLVEFPISNEKAFYSVAPLSRAIHELGAEMNLFVIDKKSESLEALKRTWLTYLLDEGQKKKALDEFIKEVNKKSKSKYFEKLFKAPDHLITASGKHFFFDERELGFELKWFKKRKWKETLATCRRILEQGYALKKRERFSVSFELIPTKKDLLLPLDDYLDNFVIGRAMAIAAKKKCTRISLGSSTAKMSQLEKMNRISDLSSTLVGCEYDKNINEPVFKKFKKLSKLMRFEKLKPNQAAFGVSGRGYGGKHFFGMTIGYPTPNRKSRWQGPGTMFLKPFWYEQTKIDNREPQTRFAITGTLPLESFIRTCYIDYYKLRKIDQKIASIVKKGKTLFVRGKEIKQGRTELTVDLTRILEKKSPVLGSDIEVNPSTPHESAGIFKMKSGRYGNFPGGEVFWTPYGLNGTYIGDVVINVDQSYVIGNKNPLVVKIKDGKYRVVSGPKKILAALKKRKSEAKKMINILAKSKSTPKSIINTYRRNFDMVGEFAINTNPKAKLSRYLIETEKIAKMMHIALGSGYEPSRETTYHSDIVLNCPRQKVDIWVETPKKEIIWIMRKGNLVV